MIKFLMWYFPLKLIGVIILFVTGFFNNPVTTLILFADLFLIPIIATVILIFSRRKLRAGEYRVKPEGRRL